jgi:hypothetical protein
VRTALTASSDGKTPEEQIKQILQIHAILPGQKPERQFDIPVRKSEANPTQESTQPMGQVPTEPSAQPLTQIPTEQPQTVQTEPVVQHQQQSVGLPTNFDGPATHAPLSKNSSIPNDPSNPPTIPFQKPKPVPESDISPENREQISEELPPSKLLHSNPAPEPRKDPLRRKDSETHEDDEFHDAQS